jgi:hypothetical protein
LPARFFWWTAFVIPEREQSEPWPLRAAAATPE